MEGVDPEATQRSQGAVEDGKQTEIPEEFAKGLFDAARVSQGCRMWEPPSAEDLQREFPQYRIASILGRGGMGAVYKGWQLSLDRPVAIKILPPGIDDDVSGFAERFRQEAKAMAKLRHPGIVAVHDAGVTPTGWLYFVMECVEGTDLHHRVSEQGKLSVPEALRIIVAVCDTLGYAHENGIIHRDIKPSNIMLDRNGTVRITDFGLAKSGSIEGTVTTTDFSMGTPDFMAPEASNGGPVDHRADIYAVGVMLYQMFTGRLPRGRFERPSRVVPRLDKGLDAIVDRTLQSERSARYPSAIELKAALEPVLIRAIDRRTGACDKMHRFLEKARTFCRARRAFDCRNNMGSHAATGSPEGHSGEWDGNANERRTDGHQGCRPLAKPQ